MSQSLSDEDLQKIAEKLKELHPLNNGHVLSGDQYIKVGEIIDNKIKPLEKRISKNEEDIVDLKLCLKEITSVSGFLKWSIPIGITVGIALGSAIAKLT